MSGLLARLTSPYLLLAFAPLCWAGNMIVGRAVRGDIPPIGLNWWRWAIAAVILLLLLRRSLWRQRRLLLRCWRLVLLLALSGIAIFHSSVYMGLRDTTAVNAGLIIALGPVLIAPLAWMILGERVTALQCLGVALSCAGVVAVITRGRPAALLALDLNPGDLWLLLASVSWSVYSVLLKRKPREIEVLALLAAISLTGVALLTPLYVWEMTRGLLVPATPQSLVAIGYVSLFASVLAFMAWNRGVHEVGASKAGLFLHLLPVYSAGLAALFLDERLELYHLYGFAFIVVGLVVTGRYGPAARAEE